MEHETAENSRELRRRRSCQRYPHTLYVRATAQEKRRIETLARAAQVSASRYVVRTVLEGQPPPTEEERQELRTLRFLLEKVSVNLNQIAHKTNRAWLRGEPLPPQQEIDGVVQGVKRLSQEIRKRLGKR
jgi:hypothetical protein